MPFAARLGETTSVRKGDDVWRLVEELSALDRIAVASRTASAVRAGMPAGRSRGGARDAATRGERSGAAADRGALRKAGAMRKIAGKKNSRARGSVRRRGASARAGGRGGAGRDTPAGGKERPAGTVGMNGRKPAAEAASVGYVWRSRAAVRSERPLMAADTARGTCGGQREAAAVALPCARKKKGGGAAAAKHSKGGNRGVGGRQTAPCGGRIVAHRRRGPCARVVGEMGEPETRMRKRGVSKGAGRKGSQKGCPVFAPAEHRKGRRERDLLQGDHFAVLGSMLPPRRAARGAVERKASGRMREGRWGDVKPDARLSMGGRRAQSGERSHAKRRSRRGAAVGEASSRARRVRRPLLRRSLEGEGGGSRRAARFRAAGLHPRRDTA